MYDPSMRVLTVLELLGTYGRMSGRDLAAHLEVSGRTVQRYVARLQDLGIPVEGSRGPGGCYRLRLGFRLPPLMFGLDEALALTLGLEALTFLGLREVAPATAGAKAKLERVLPEAVSAAVGALRSVLELERPRWVVDADVTLLVRLASAVHAFSRVRLRYADQGGATSERVLEPLGTMQHKGRWFVAGYCLLRRDRRLFRVDRVRAAVVLSETFARPAEFEMAAFLRESLASMPAPWAVVVWLSAPPEAVARGWLGARVVLEAEAGGTRLSCGAMDLEAFAASLLHLSLSQPGYDIVVRELPALLTAFGRLAERAQRVAAEGAVPS